MCPTLRIQRLDAFWDVRNPACANPRSQSIQRLARRRPRLLAARTCGAFLPLPRPVTAGLSIAGGYSVDRFSPQESMRCLARVPDFMTADNARARWILQALAGGQYPVPTALVVLAPAPLPAGCFVRGAHRSVGRYVPIYKNIAVVNSPHSYSNITSAPATCRNRMVMPL